jgi:hypothetical protein
MHKCPERPMIYEVPNPDYKNPKRKSDAFCYQPGDLVVSNTPMQKSLGEQMREKKEREKEEKS